MHRVAARASLEVSGCHGHRGAQRRPVFHQDDPAVVIDVWPFVRIGGPGIRSLETFAQLTVLRRDTGPQTKSSVDMDPRALLVRTSTNISGWIECSGVHISGLHAKNGAIAQPRHFIRPHPSLAVHRNLGHTLLAKPCKAQRL